MIGPVPSVIEVQLAAEITMSGSIAATVSATATSAAGARMHCDTSAGCSGARHNSGSFSGSYLGEEVSTVSASFGPSISATLDGGLALELSAAPNLSIDVNKCLMTFKAGFSQSIAFNLSFFGHGTVGFNFDLLNIEVTLGTIPISNCVIWSGTLSLNSHVNYVGVETTRDANGSSSMTIDDVHGVPPAFQVYPMSGSGSGTTIEKHFFTCGGAPPTPAVWTYQYNWAGDITNAGTGKVSVDIAATGAPGGWRLFVVGHPSTQADQTITIVDSNCTTIVDTAHIDDWQQDVFSVFSPGDTSTTIGTLFFTVAPGSSTSVGTATFPADENTPGYTLHWSLTKTCLMGGTAC
jgi:hypothetical protein